MVFKEHTIPIAIMDTFTFVRSFSCSFIPIRYMFTLQSWCKHKKKDTICILCASTRKKYDESFCYKKKNVYFCTTKKSFRN